MKIKEQRSDRLKELRFNKNLTQRDVATLLGISHGAYSGWEFHETRTIPVHFLRKLAEILETTPEQILYGKDQPLPDESLSPCCKICQTPTMNTFNIDFKVVPICEDCASSIFLQQAQWYVKETSTPKPKSNHGNHNPNN